MSVNAGNLNLSIEQAGRVLNAAFKQASGQSVISQLATGDYVSIATMAQRVGYESMTNALSQVLTRTYIRVRPYTAKFPALIKTEEQFGNMVRKVQYIDRDIPEGDMTRTLEDGKEYSPYKVRKPVAVQTAYYGFNHVDDYITIFKNQWDTALTSGSELQRFISGIMQEWYNKLEQYHEQYSRATIINLIGGTSEASKVDSKHPEMVRHLLTEYNTEHGTTLTRDALLADKDAFTQFAEDLAYKMDIIVRQMGERTTLYHVSPAQSVVEGDKAKGGGSATYYPLKRHTPRENLQCYMLAPFWDRVKRTVRPGLFANEYLEFIKFDEVAYWQDIQAPEQVNADVSYFKSVAVTPALSSGNTYALVNDSAEAAVELPYVLGIMFDDEAASICYKNMWSAATPMNPAHGFQTNYIHEDMQWRNDNTENACLLLLD